MNIDTEKVRKTFKAQNYAILRTFIPQEMVDFLYSYGRMRRKSAMTMIKTGYSDYRPAVDGTFMDKKVPGTYSVYSDPAMETLLVTTQDRLNAILGLSLVPTYTYWRLYKKGDVLAKHKDRGSCEVSATLCVGYNSGDKEAYHWPIYMNSSCDASQPTTACELRPGDLVIYRGCEVEHWREALEGKEHMQVFLHYNDTAGVFKHLSQYDCRPHLGLPAGFRDSEKEAAIKKILQREIRGK